MDFSIELDDSVELFLNNAPKAKHYLSIGKRYLGASQHYKGQECDCYLIKAEISFVRALLSMPGEKRMQPNDRQLLTDIINTRLSETYAHQDAYNISDAVVQKFIYRPKDNIKSVLKMIRNINSAKDKDIAEETFRRFPFNWTARYNFAVELFKMGVNEKSFERIDFARRLMLEAKELSTLDFTKIDDSKKIILGLENASDEWLEELNVLNKNPFIYLIDLELGKIYLELTKDHVDSKTKQQYFISAQGYFLEAADKGCPATDIFDILSSSKITDFSMESLKESISLRGVKSIYRANSKSRLLTDISKQYLTYYKNAESIIK